MSIDEISGQNNINDASFENEPHEEDVFSLIKPVEYEEFKQTLGTLEKLNAEKRYQKYLEQVQMENERKQFNKVLYDETLEEILKYLAGANEPDRWISHEADYLAYLEQELLEARTREENFLIKHVNDLFLKGIRTIYTIAIVTTINNKQGNDILKKLESYLGAYLHDRDGVTIDDKKALMSGLLSLTDDLDDQQDITSNLYRKLLVEATSAYDRLEVESEVLKQQFQKFSEHIDQITAEIDEYRRVYSSLKDPDELYGTLVDMVLGKLVDERDQKVTANYIINGLRKNIVDYKNRRDSLKDGIDTQQAVLENAIRDFGIYLSQEYDKQCEMLVQQRDSVDVESLDGCDIEELGTVYVGLQKKLYQPIDPTVQERIGIYNSKHGGELVFEEIDITPAMKKDSMLREKIQYLLTKDLLASYTTEYLQLQQAISAKEKEYAARVSESFQSSVYDLLRDKKHDIEGSLSQLEEIQSKIEQVKNTFLERIKLAGDGAQGVMVKGIPGYFDEEQQLSELLLQNRSSLLCVQEEVEKYLSTLDTYRSELNGNHLKELQGVSRPQFGRYEEWIGELEEAGLTKESHIKKYLVLEAAETRFELDDGVVVKTRAGDIFLLEGKTPVMEYLEGSLSDYTDLSGVTLYTTANADGTTNQETIDRLLQLAVQGDASEKFRNMVNSGGIHVTGERVSNETFSIPGPRPTSSIISELYQQATLLEMNYKLRYVDQLAGYSDSNILIKSIENIHIHGGLILEEDGDHAYDIVDLEDGALVKKKKYRTIRSFSEGRAAAQNLDGTWCFINSVGEELEAGENYTTVLPFSEGYSAVKRVSGKRGYIDRQGKLLGDGYIYSQAKNFSNGFARVRQGFGPWGYINTQGEPVGQGYVYDGAKSFSHGYAPVKDVNGNRGFINEGGEWVRNGSIYRDAEPFSHGYAVVRGQNLDWGFINSNGQYLGGGMTYKHAMSFTEGLAGVINTDGSRSYIDPQGNQVIDCSEYGEIRGFTWGCAAVRNQDGLRGFIDHRGELLGDGCIYEYARSFAEGYAVVKKVNGDWGYIDREGNVLGDGFVYQSASDFIEGIAQVRTYHREGNLRRDGSVSWL